MRKKAFVILAGTALLAGSFLLGSFTAKQTTKAAEPVSERYIDTESEEFRNNFLDMRKVTDFSATDTSVMLYLENREGYYWER